MNLKEYLISIGRLPENVSSERETEESFSKEPKNQTIGEVFDLMKEKYEDKLPANFLGVNAENWTTQFKHPYL
jgi:hypothetical protein